MTVLQANEEDTGRARGEREGESLEDLCTVVENVYPTILRGLRVVQSEAIEDEIEVFPGLMNVVRLFQAFLGRLHKSALGESIRRNTKARGEITAQLLDAAATKTKVPVAAIDDVKHGKIISLILVKMARMLDVSQEVHCRLLEGFLCVLLDHVGSLLSLLVFNDPESAQEDNTGVLPPTEMVDVAHVDSQAVIEAAKIEGPYTVFVLRKILEFFSTNTKQMSQKSLSLFSRESLHMRKGEDSQQMIMRTLQNTLLRGIFGDDDDTFRNSLRREEDEGDVDLRKVVNDMKQCENTTHWFIGQIWEHLGWDVLSGKESS